MTSETTGKTIACPRCGASASTADIRCPSCGVNLALAVARAATEQLLAKRTDTGLLYEADRHLPRFGEFLLRNGDITESQLQAALQRQAGATGQHRTIGQILLEMGAVNREQLDKASLSQIGEFQQALTQANDRLAKQGARIRRLENALAEMAALNLSAVNLIDSARERLAAALLSLEKAQLGADDDALAALADLRQLAVELQAMTARDR
jgi:hypothetical protein